MNVSTRMLYALSLITLATVATLAVPRAEYLGRRATAQPLALADGVAVAGQLAQLAGKTVELEGAVSCTFDGKNGPGFMLTLPGNQLITFLCATLDPMVQPGYTLLALATVPANGSELLACMALTTVGDYDIPTQPALPKITYVATLPTNTATAIAPPPPVDTDKLPLCQRNDVVNAYAEKIRDYNHHLDYNESYGMAYNILEQSEAQRVDPRLVFALIRAESDFNPTCVSSAGASGLGQLMPETAAGMGITDIFDVEQNIAGSVRELRDCLDTFNGDVKLALAGYNAGCGAVRKYDGIPPYPETQNYVITVWALYCELAGI